MSDEQCAVGINGVTKRFGEAAPAVDDLDLQIRDGEFFSLLGPSGCGKTTTLRMIAGLEFPTEGSLRIFGEEMGLRPPNQRPVNTVFQSYALFPHMTVEQNVVFGLEMQDVPKAEARSRAGDAIDLVRLGGMATRKPGQLSGGQQQRVALARALVNRPKVLLLDEPLAALDLKLRQAMQIELKEIQRQVGITFVFVTHDQEEALTMSDRIGVMNEGKLLQVGPSEDIYERPNSRFVAEVIGETNFIPGTVVGKDRVKLINGIEVSALAEQPVGTQVTLTLRPEKIHLHEKVEDAPETYNNVPCKVVRRMYFGDSRYYELEGGVGCIVDCRVENIPRLEVWDVGDEPVLSFHPQAAEALAE
jgi:spermidine/putrescine transport system ATP-binding protein